MDAVDDVDCCFVILGGRLVVPVVLVVASGPLWPLTGLARPGSWRQNTTQGLPIRPFSVLFVLFFISLLYFVSFPSSAPCLALCSADFCVIFAVGKEWPPYEHGPSLDCRWIAVPLAPFWLPLAPLVGELLVWFGCPLAPSGVI